MPVRTSHAEVEGVLRTTIAAGGLDGFISDASLWVDNYMVGACDLLNEDKLPVIEKYLAAHFYQLSVEGTGGQLIASAAADVKDTYAERSGSDAGTTTFLRTAAAFDPCGIIAGFFFGGRRASGSFIRGYGEET